jgi:4-amino-4-deoxy-L-arabinose transferase-like glycosyltransferase
MSGSRQRSWLLAAILYAVAYGFHLSAAIYLHRSSTLAELEEDETEYYTWAGKLLDGETEFNPRRPIVHVGTVAALRWATGDDLFAIRVGLLSLFSLTAPLTFALVVRYTGSRRAAFLAGLGVAGWPLFVRFSGTLYAETTATPLFLLFLLIVPSAANREAGVGRWLLAGLVLGLATLSRAQYMLYLPFAALTVAIEGGVNWRAVARVLLVGVGWAAVCLPYSLALSRQSDHFVLVSSGGGETLAGTYNPKLIERGIQHEVLSYGRVRWTGPGKWLLDIDTGYITLEEAKLPLAEKDALLRARALAWMREHPAEVAYLTAMKLLLMWGFLPHLENLQTVVLGNLPILVLVPLSALAVVRLWPSKRHLARFWLPFFFASLVAVAAWGSWRYRQPRASAHSGVF